MDKDGRRGGGEDLSSKFSVNIVVASKVTLIIGEVLNEQPISRRVNSEEKSGIS